VLAEWHVLLATADRADSPVPADDGLLVCAGSRRLAWLSPAKALFFSFVACLRNWRAFLVYSLAILVVATLLPGLHARHSRDAAAGSAALLAIVMTVLLILVLAPTLFASFYVSYRDVFVTYESDA
jgi:hypothetical protein